MNGFHLSCKLAWKTRVDGRVTTRYHLPTAPRVRHSESEAVPETVKDTLYYTSFLDRPRLPVEIRTMQDHVAEIAAGELSAYK